MLKPFISVLSWTLWLCLFIPTQAGRLNPDATNPIVSSISNKAELSDYTFTFSPDTAMPAGTQVYAEFPTQYRSGLGIPISPVCSVACSIDGLIAKFTIPTAVASGASVSVTIKDVENPESKGGTGSFKLSTVRGVNVLDENIIFGTIGIADSVSNLASPNVVLAAGESSATGAVSNYSFYFKPSQYIASGSYIKLTINDGNFGLAATPLCYAIVVNGKTMKGNFSCRTSGRNIIVTGLNTSIPALQDVGLNVQMKNPLVAGISGTFGIAILRGGTNVIYDDRADITGVTITPSRMSSVSLTPIDTTRIQGKNKIMTYILRFKPKNALPTGAAIQISLPVGFQLDSTSPYAHYILYGLQDVSESSPVGMSLDYVNNLIKITNFASMASPDEIGVRLRLQNPSVSGTTNIGSITTYVDSTLAVAIDKSQRSMYTTIAGTDVATSYSITTQNLIAGTTLTAVEFLYQPATTVPVGGILQVILPTNYNVGTIISGSCQVKPSSGSYTTATCTSSGSIISITIPSASAFTSGTVNYFKLNGIVIAPAANSTALFDVTSYQSDTTTVIESWSAPLVTVAPGFTASAATSLCVGAGKTTALRISFTPTVAVPSADVQVSANSTKGIIEFAFTGMASDLGTGLTSISTIPCQVQTGITPISGALVCTLIPGSLPVIRLSNFQSIASGTSVMVKFPKIANPTIVPSGNTITVTAKTTSLTNRIRTDLNQGPVTFNVNTAVALTQSGTIASSTYVFSSNIVSTTTQLVFNSGTTAAITGSGYFIVMLPSYDIGWISASSTLTCKLGATTQTCFNYPGADWVTINLPAATTFAANAQITITGLTVPRYSNSAIGGLTLRYVDSTFQETANFIHSAFPVASVPAFNVASFTASLYNSGAVNVLYTFTFNPPNDVPAGSTLLINFPTSYNLLASNPPVAVSSPTLVALSSSTPVSFSYSFSYVTITNFQAITANTAITIRVSGVKNPTGVITSAGWSAYLSYGGGTLVASSSFQQFDFLAVGASYYLAVNSITAYPMNAGVKATYTISFTPVTSIPAYGQIYITFPSLNYKILPSPPTCKVSGAITTYSSCTLKGSSYIITLDTQYSGGNIVVQFSDILNPSAGTTDLFVITTYYDSLVLDSTENIVTTNRQITIEAAPSMITMESLTFDPKNEGETSTYTFSFLPTTALTSDMTIEIVFPSTYDSYLGNTVSCSIKSGLSGNVLCSVSKRIVSFVGFSDYTPDITNPITILIYGVVNPNQQLNADSGQFKIGTRLTSSQYYVDFIAKAGTLETTAAPGWAILWEVEPENLLARTSSDYTFNFSTFSDIPQKSLGGAVRIDLPIEFEVNDQNLTCETTTQNFASTLSCYIQKNSIYVTGNTANYGGNVIIIVRALTNPVSAGTTSDIQLKTYNSFTSEIIERTYKTLDPFSFSYTLPGPLVLVNNDETITVERGTESEQFFITMDYPSALDLTYNPITPGFSVTPFYISMPVGSNKASFRITVDESFAMGTYYIQWQVLGELVPAYYTPIRRTKVIVVSNKNLVINCPTVYPIPLGGNSLPLVFTVPNGPNTGITISAKFVDVYPDVSLSTTEIQFTPGQTKGTLLISALSNSTVTDGAVFLSVSGVNKDVYTLESEYLNFTIVAADSTAPTISNFAVTGKTMNSVNFTFQASEIAMAYYVLALRYTTAPTLDQATELGPAPYQTTASKYRSLLVEDPTVLSEVTISGLVAETSYTVFLYLVDRGGNNVGPQTVNFTTDDRYEAADFSLRFNQDSLNDAEKQVAINSVAFLLSLKSSQVQLKEYSFVRRVLQDGFLQESEERNLQYSGSTLLDLEIMAIPNSTLYPSPYELALMLNDKIAELDERMNNFDTSYVITATNFTSYIPAFYGTPSSTASTLYTASFSVALNNYGNVYVVCVKTSEDTGVVPSPYQIWQGFNSQNIEVPHGSVEVSKKNTAFAITVEGLDSASSYNAYVIGGSAHPGFPDLMDSTAVVTLTFKTLTPPKVVEVVKKSGNLVQGITAFGAMALGLALIL